jgi:hypothetical protein
MFTHSTEGFKGGLIAFKLETTRKVCMDNSTPITEQQFELICSEIETTELGTDKCAQKIGVSPVSFRQYLEIVGDHAKTRYARSKETQSENLMDRISEIQEQCINEIRTIEDPKRCNAIQNAYKEQIRHIEWIASKLKPKKYGDKIDVTSNGEAITREISITPIVSK